MPAALNVRCTCRTTRPGRRTALISSFVLGRRADRWASRCRRRRLRARSLARSAAALVAERMRSEFEQQQETPMDKEFFRAVMAAAEASMEAEGCLRARAEVDPESAELLMRQALELCGAAPGAGAPTPRTVATAIVALWEVAGPAAQERAREVTAQVLELVALPRDWPARREDRDELLALARRLAGDPLLDVDQALAWIAELHRKAGVVAQTERFRKIAKGVQRHGGGAGALLLIPLMADLIGALGGVEISIRGGARRVRATVGPGVELAEPEVPIAQWVEMELEPIVQRCADYLPHVKRARIWEAMGCYCATRLEALEPPGKGRG